MGTHISLLGNIYSYGSYPGYTLGSTSLPLPISLMMSLNNRLYFRLLCDHLMGMRLMGVYLTGVHLMGVYLMGVHLAPHRRASHGHVSHGPVLYRRASRVCTSWACISRACISWACISRACISWACISRASHGCAPHGYDGRKNENQTLSSTAL